MSDMKSSLEIIVNMGAVGGPFSFISEIDHRLEQDPRDVFFSDDNLIVVESPYGPKGIKHMVKSVPMFPDSLGQQFDVWINVESIISIEIMNAIQIEIARLSHAERLDSERRQLESLQARAGLSKIFPDIPDTEEREEQVFRWSIFYKTGSEMALPTKHTTVRAASESEAVAEFERGAGGYCIVTNVSKVD